MSVTAGPPGLSVNLGKRGAYLNTGLPGTGLYERTRLDSAGAGPRGGDPRREADDPHAQLLELTGDELVGALDLRFAVEEDGTVGTFFPDGQALADARMLRKVRRSDSFRRAAAELRQSYVDELEREMQSILGCAGHAPEPASRAGLEARLEELSLKPEQPRTFPVPPPTLEDSRSELRAAARRAVSFWPPWTRKRRRDNYVDERLEDLHRERLNRWEQDRQLFAHQEGERVALRNRELRRAYEAQRTRLEGLLAGTGEEVAAELEHRLSGFAYPLPFEVEIAVEDGGLLALSVDLPEVEDLPRETARILASGKLSVRDRSDRQLKRDYGEAISALALTLAAHGFASSPAVTEVAVTGYTQRRDPATGREADVTVLDALVDRERFAALNLSAGEPQAMLRSFSPRLFDP